VIPKKWLYYYNNYAMYWRYAMHLDTAIKESTKSAHRVKLDVTLRAPLVVLPYRTKTTEGEICIDLGDFQLSNE